METMTGSAPEDVLSLLESPKEPGVASPESPSDEMALESSLVEGCRNGDAGSYRRLYELHGERMKSLAANLLSSTHEAEDAIQETFLRVYRNVAGFKGESAFTSWIYRILINVCYDLMRKRKRRKPEIQEPLSDPGAAEAGADTTSDHSLRLTIESGLRKLEGRRRSVFLLFEVEGFRHREIAQMLNIPEGTSKNLLFEAKRELQSLLSASSRDRGKAHANSM